jgi:hypothetical protein
VRHGLFLVKKWEQGVSRIEAAKNQDDEHLHDEPVRVCFWASLGPFGRLGWQGSRTTRTTRLTSRLVCRSISIPAPCGCVVTEILRGQPCCSDARRGCFIYDYVSANQMHMAERGQLSDPQSCGARQGRDRTSQAWQSPLNRATQYRHAKVHASIYDLHPHYNHLWKGSLTSYVS